MLNPHAKSWGFLYIYNMVYEIKKYFCDRIPEKEDITDALEKIVVENVVIDLCWYGPAHGYYGNDEYSTRIRPADTVEEIMNRLPKIYGV